MSLTDYAENRRGGYGTGCWACRLPDPIREEMDRVRKTHGIGPDQVRNWLVKDHGYLYEDVRRGSIANHFAARHHES